MRDATGKRSESNVDKKTTRCSESWTKHPQLKIDKLNLLTVWCSCVTNIWSHSFSDLFDWWKGVYASTASVFHRVLLSVCRQMQLDLFDKIFLNVHYLHFARFAFSSTSWSFSHETKETTARPLVLLVTLNLSLATCQHVAHSANMEGTLWIFFSIIHKLLSNKQGYHRS